MGSTCLLRSRLDWLQFQNTALSKSETLLKISLYSGEVTFQTYAQFCLLDTCFYTQFLVCTVLQRCEHSSATILFYTHTHTHTHTALINRRDFTTVLRGRVETKKSRPCKIVLTSSSAWDITCPTLIPKSEILLTLSFARIIWCNVFKAEMSDI